MYAVEFYIIVLSQVFLVSALKKALNMQGCRLVCSVLIEGNFTNYLLIQCSDFSYAPFIQNKICAFKIFIDGS